MQPGLGLDGIAQTRSERSRAITAENPEGEVGAGGQASSNLGPGRKGSPNRDLPAGEEVALAEIDGPGVIRHIWITVPMQTDTLLRDLVFRCYWDGEDEPSVEVPLGDFFCNGHSDRHEVHSMPIVVASHGGMNCYWPMPFEESARVTIENPLDETVHNFFYQFDYGLVDELDDDTAYLHAQWRRTNPTELGEDHVIVDGIEGRGHYVGTYLSWAALSGYWWGEGEVKFYLDGDEEWPTICGTGAEDYVGGAWGFGNGTYDTPFLGYPLEDDEGAVDRHGLYRWHVPDPVHFREDLRATIQAIGHDGQLFERSDDVSSVAYWYQHEPHAPFPELPDRRGRRPR